MAKNTLTYKQRAFVEAYLSTWSSVKAAKVAGYAWPTKSGPRVMHETKVAEEIERRLSSLCMGANEILLRLTQQASANAADFIIFEDVPELDENGNQKVDLSGKMICKRAMKEIDWKEVERKGYLIKSIKYDRKGRPMLEFYDTQAALVQLGKHQQLFTDQINVRDEQVNVTIYIPDNGREANADDHH